MPKKIITVVFWISTTGLILFCLMFATPIVSGMVANKLMLLAGCKPATFDMLAVCPAGSWATPFAGLSGWLSSLLAPITFVVTFWPLLLVWSGLCCLLGWLAYLRK